MHDPNDPYRADHPDRPVPARHLDTRTEGDGLGAIIAVVAIAALVIIGMLYVMMPPSPAQQASQSPPASSPATPGPTKSTPQ